MNLNIVQIWAIMAPPAKVVSAVLLAMAISCLGVALERLIAFSVSTKDSRKFAARAGNLVEQLRFEELLRLADGHPRSALARLFGSIASRYVNACEDPGEGGLSAVDLARNESARRLVGIGEEIRRGMNALATIGSVAPLVGVLGTIVGIIGAFQDPAAASAGVGVVLVGLSAALVPTALGLLVAVAAIVAGSYFKARAGAMDSALGRSAGELLDELENHRGRGGAASSRMAA